MNRKQRRRQASLQPRQVTAPASRPDANSAAVEATLASAVQNLQAGNAQQAAALLERVLTEQPSNHVAVHHLGLIALQAGQNETAVDLIGKSVALRPDYAEAHSNLGIALKRLGRLDEAVASYRTAIALKPDYAEAHSNLGAALMGQGKIDEAVAAYRKAVSLKPDYAEVHYNLGHALMGQGKLDEAVACHRHAIALKPNFAEAHSNLGVALMGQGKLDEAVASYRTAITLKPDFAEAHANLGIALKNLGKLDEAVAAYRKAIALKPDYAETHANLGTALMGQGKIPLAVGATAEVFAWKDGQVLKLFRERFPFHEHEVAATRAASATGLPVPAVIDGLIEVQDRRGIVFERVNGPTMARYLEDRPDLAIECASQMVDLHVEIHQREVSDILELGKLLAWAIGRADGLTPGIRNAVLGVLDRLPGGTALCHGDFHPHNIIMAAQGPVAIDWSVGARGNPLADFARTWLISRLWLSNLSSGKPKQYWSTFWQTYLRRYRELRSCPESEVVNWQIVTTAASLFLDPPLNLILPAATDRRLDFVHAMLRGGTHRWKT